MYTINITNEITGYKFPIETSNNSLSEIEEYFANVCLKNGMHITNASEYMNGMQMQAENDDKSLKYTIQIIGE